MIHPDTHLNVVSPEVGYGVFASHRIPKGTIVYIKDALEIEIPVDSPLLDRPEYEQIIRKYSYIEAGKLIISWDIEKYVNHSCDSNTLSTGYGFEIVVRDIEPGEELRDDYGPFNVDYGFACGCGASTCRGKIRQADFSTCAPHWDSRIKEALALYQQVEQPLEVYMDEDTQKGLYRYLQTGQDYRSVEALKE
ncbi:MAG: SET domain-containing protein [Elainellaceae cyanobacterium]